MSPVLSHPSGVNVLQVALESWKYGDKFGFERKASRMTREALVTQNSVVCMMEKEGLVKCIEFTSSCGVWAGLDSAKVVLAVNEPRIAAK